VNRFEECVKRVFSGFDKMTCMHVALTNCHDM